MSTDSARQPEKFYPKFETLADTLERVLKNIKCRGKEPKYKAGLWFLDQGTWGIEPTQLMTIAARPGVGKTALACQIAIEYAKQGYKVAFLSLEMTKETILERMFCIDQEIDAFQLRTGNMDESIEEKYSKFCANVGLLNLRIIDDYCHNERELYTLIEHLEFRPDIIFLDHIQQIQTQHKKSMWETLTEYLRYLKQLAMQYKIAVVALSQINREGEEKPTLANLKGTGGIEEMSDFVLLMHKLKEPTENGNNFKIAIAKNRFGMISCYELFFRSEYLRFYNQSPYLKTERVDIYA